MTTTAVDLDEELLNRCLVLSVDEDREQTRAIHRFQRESWTLEGLRKKDEREAVLARHRNAQRLLEPVAVVNPYAPQLEFLDTQVRTRRDHTKYLGLIASITYLHQHQRRRVTVDTKRRGTIECVEVAPEDVELANRLAHEVLGRTLDELPPQTRRLLELLYTWVSEECERLGVEQSGLRFLLREARAWTGFGQTQLKIHMARLVDLEYVVVHRGGRGQSFVYELVYAGEGAGEGAEGARFVVGLNARAARSTGDRSGQTRGWSGREGDRSGSNRGRIGPESGGGRDEQITDSSSNHGAFRGNGSISAETPRLGGPNKRAPGDRRPPASVAGNASAQGRGS